MNPKIITLWQPWASLVAYGFKQYETRSWATNYRGPLLIHAAKRPFVHPTSGKVLCRDSDRAWLDALDLAYEGGIIDDQMRLPDQTRVPFSHELPLGAVVAICNLRQCERMRLGVGGYVAPIHEIQIDRVSELERAVGNWTSDRYAWRLSKVQRLAMPITWKGAQGLRNAPPELLSLVKVAYKGRVA
ncbi:MAG: ASCH domain-containing protein [Leptolyngbya sp. SIOISBB]|nr:ASCH domain-containing protein [Leptolyngbya sp. SIOISBB]